MLDGSTLLILQHWIWLHDMVKYHEFNHLMSHVEEEEEEEDDDDDAGSDLNRT